MFTIFVGLLFIAFSVYACLPNGLGWGEEVIYFLKGASPVVAALIAIVAILVGIADIKDRREARLEEEEALRSESEN